METKTQKIKDLLNKGDLKKAISIASKFFDRGDDTAIFKTAQSAMQNPNFYKQIGKNPEALISKAESRLKERFL